jgi:protein TonB
MNNNLILPASLALTLHAFLFFGLTGKTPPDAAGDPETKESLKKNVVSVDSSEPMTVTDTEDLGNCGEGPGGPAVSTLTEIPVLNPPYDAIVIPTRPPVKGDPTVTTIPPGWQNPASGRTGTEDVVVDTTKLDRPPRVRSQPAPYYPADLRKDRIEGTVVVEFLVDKAGNVYSPVVLQTTNPGFSGPAVRAVARWRFEPARSAGRNVRFRMTVPLVFRIEDT